MYLTKFNKIRRETIIKCIKRENTVLYLKLEIINCKFPLIIKRPDLFNKIKKTLIIILNITLTGIYNRILDKRITKKGFIK